MPSLKSTPKRIVTNFFFGLNAACKPPRRPHSNTLPTSLQFPSRPLQFPSRPEGAKALYGAPNMIYKPKKIGEKMM